MMKPTCEIIVKDMKFVEKLGKPVLSDGSGIT